MTPWDDPRTPWKTKSAFMGYLRGCLRKAWTRHPVRLAVVNNSRKLIDNPNPKGHRKQVWGFTCPLCDITDVIKNAQVDHINPCGSLRSIEDIQGFAERLLVVVEEDLRLICSGCNSCLAYRDKMGITFEQAKLEKEIIAFTKLTIAKQTSILLKAGFEKVDISNAKNRKAAYRSILIYEDSK